MHGNRVKSKLDAGGVATVLVGHSQTSDTIDFLGPLGFDGYWLEGEHGPIDWSRIGDLTRACDLWNMTSVMRVHANEPGLIGRTLDCGVSGLVVPHVDTRAQAEQVVQAARFSPAGKRGMYGGRRSYGTTDFFQQANDEILLVVLIEDILAVENLDEILQVDHIDVFFVAPTDLAQSMGRLAGSEEPQVQEVVRQTLGRIAAAGRVPGAMGSIEHLADYRDLGTRFFLTGYDAWIAEGAARYLDHPVLAGSR
ncbi:MAG: hypothetical protein GKR89_08525 [Candidatus Latescibacteria bacterium]|nr:hypothetical protein [Candidatus Latescibacterota bacterium]